MLFNCGVREGVGVPTPPPVGRAAGMGYKDPLRVNLERFWTSEHLHETIFHDGVKFCQGRPSCAR